MKRGLKTRKENGLWRKVERTAELIAMKLKEQEGSLLEYLGEHIIGVVLIGIIMAGIALIVKTTVLPSITEKIKTAFTFS